MKDNKKSTTNIVNKINISLTKPRNSKQSQPQSSGLDVAKAEQKLQEIERRDFAYQNRFSNPNIFGFNNSTLLGQTSLVEQQRTSIRQQQEDNLRQQQVSQFQQPDIYRVPSNPQVGRQGLSMARQSQENILESLKQDFPTRVKSQEYTGEPQGGERLDIEELQRELKTRRKIEVGAKPKGRPIGSRNKPKKFSLRQEEKDN